METARITVIGAGYVGLVTGVCLANSGHDVTCVDVDAAKIEMLSSGSSPIYEPGIVELLAKTSASGRLRFATPQDGWAPLLGDIVFVAVGTPMAESGAADLTAVREVVQTVAATTDHPFTLVMKSTVPPGTGRDLVSRFLDDSPHPIGYVSNPEFLREGRALEDWYHTDRVVLGSDDPSALDAVEALYEEVDATVLRTDIASAETIKYASNAFLATKISFINEIANVCDAAGARIDDVSVGVGLDSRIGPQFLNAGIGYGGSCFPKDVRALDFISSESGYSFELVKAVIEVNARQRTLPVDALRRTLGDLSGARIAVLGLTFKPDTDDVRESPAIDIIASLVAEGASVLAYDPLASHVILPEGASRVDDAWTALTGANAVVLVTEWSEFVGLDWTRAAAAMAAPKIVFDGRNALDANALEAAGVRYMAVGRDGCHRRHDH
ncbi:MAG: UDP-glucose/GDP-mannose dehydrogenase family protein [Coriobacteriia bacterium]|nr:UDP-glucose/GDP-mannose dehydrogenase family protein [Coriobacteriia bacterium]